MKPLSGGWLSTFFQKHQWRPTTSLAGRCRLPLEEFVLTRRPPSYERPSSSRCRHRRPFVGWDFGEKLRRHSRRSTRALDEAKRHVCDAIYSHGCYEIKGWTTVGVGQERLILVTASYHWSLRALRWSSRGSWRGGGWASLPWGGGNGQSPGWCRSRWRGDGGTRSVSRPRRSKCPLQQTRDRVRRRDNGQAAVVKCSYWPGLETTIRMQLGLYLTMLGMMNLKMLTLRWTRLRRLSPSCWRAPAVTTTTLELAVTL